ncbi:hypothetical protein F0562_005746 [Nyssa sinensis]|uniref:Uncharacterized protein n=1 Tax=Nyssa sinensis TaxID=561372 RepID=A0A5J5ANP6_9ASTE|nr:hypothetical protein F0562_005746 [Nyssa sinensis]
MLEGYDGGDTPLCDIDIKGQLTLEHREEPIKPEITLHALTGWTAPKTMRIAARIGSHDVIVLIDSGSTHNFISERVGSSPGHPVARDVGHRGLRLEEVDHGIPLGESTQAIASD